MMERLYVLEEADTQEFVGVNRANLVTLQNLFPKTKLRIHQNVIKVLGEDQAAEELLHILSSLEALCSRHNQLTEAQIIEVVRRHRSKAADTLPSHVQQGLSLLTPREMEVLHAIGEGKTNAEIAAELVISATTVKTHVSNLLAKVYARDRVALAIIARKVGL